MLGNYNNDVAFASYTEMPSIPYKLIEILINDESDDANNFWKVLKYSDADCLSKDNLTSEEKYNLIWTGEDSLENNYSVFLKPLIGSSLDTAESQTQLRLYRYNTSPTTRLDGVVCFESDFITNDKASLVRKDGMLVERSDLMESLYLSLMNGRDIGIGSGYLVFDKELSRTCSSQLSINNSKSFYGRALIMALRFAESEVGGSCG